MLRRQATSVFSHFSILHRLEEQINKIDYMLGDELWLDVVSADECLGLAAYPDPVRAEQSNLADCPPQILVVP